MSNGSRRARPRALNAADRGAEGLTPRKQIHKKIMGGSGRKSEPGGSRVACSVGRPDGRASWFVECELCLAEQGPPWDTDKGEASRGTCTGPAEGLVEVEACRVRTGCIKAVAGEFGNLGRGSGASSDETDCTESELPMAEEVPSQCLVDRCSSVHRPSAPLTQVSRHCFLCQDFSNAFAADLVGPGTAGGCTSARLGALSSGVSRST